MANDLRDRNFTPYRPQPKAVQQQNAGCAGGLLAGIGVAMLLLGGLAAIGGAGTGSAVVLVMGIFLIGRGVTMTRAVRKQTARPAAKPARQPAQKPAAKRTPEAECPNPEPHRHYEAAPRKKQYDTFVSREKKWPTPQERRLENMKNLYDAGLLTKEEYDAEVRKIRG